MCCSVLQCVAVCRSVLHCVEVYCSALQCVAVFAVRCSVFLKGGSWVMTRCAASVLP